MAERCGVAFRRRSRLWGRGGGSPFATAQTRQTSAYEGSTVRTTAPTPIMTDFTVIVAHVDPGVSLLSCVDAIDRACRDVNGEIVVVQSAEIAAHAAPVSSTPLTMIRVAGGGLVPQLWARGLAVAQGKYVAFTLANCEVSGNWASGMMAVLQSGASGVAGPIECARDVGLINRAIYYLRYSAFIPARATDADVSGEIPGDNAAYRRDALDRHRELIADGFWEVLFHRKLRAEGGRLRTCRGGRVRFRGGVGLRQALRHRFAHGRHFGAWRVADGQRRWWQIGAAAVPLLLMIRAGLRVVGSPVDRWAFVTTIPIFLTVATAWALGEVVGAMSGPRLPVVRQADAEFAGVAHGAAETTTAAMR